MYNVLTGQASEIKNEKLKLQNVYRHSHSIVAIATTDS